MALPKHVALFRKTGCGEMTINVEEEVKQLVEEIKRLGAKGPDGKTTVREPQIQSC